MRDFEALISQIKCCTLCGLSETRSQAVPGEGSVSAEVMFVGEGPGFYEDRDGRPFVGPSGKFLDELLTTINLNRETVYITNMVKCRPPNNRDPLTIEVDACRPYLDNQIKMISPKVIVTLGRHSFSKFFPSKSLTKFRGQPQSWNGTTVYPMYHPAAALHNPRLRPVIIDDFKQLAAIIERPKQSPEIQDTAYKQLSLFN